MVFNNKVCVKYQDLRILQDYKFRFLELVTQCSHVVILVGVYEEVYKFTVI